MLWGHAIGIYLLAGVVLNGLGHLVRARWIASGKMEPLKLGKHGRLAVVVGIGTAVLLWPVLIVTISIGWRMRRKTRQLEKFLGYCEHASALEPICGPCSRAMDQERDLKTGIHNYIVGRRPEDQKAAELAAKAHLAELQRRFQAGRSPEEQKAAELATKAQLADLARRLQDLERGALGSKGVPEVPAVESLYQCSTCGLMSKGPAPAANAQGWPLCVKCKIEDLKRIK